MDLTRRGFLGVGAASAGLWAAGQGAVAFGAAEEVGESVLPRIQTPHKHPSLVLEASYKPGEFDSLAVDVPFVFEHDGRYHMTFVGFDGTGYRTGLATSDDLIHWKKEGLVLDRGPKGSITEFNVALTWIVRENELFGPATLKKIDGRYLGTYHAYPKPGYEVGSAVIGLCWSTDLRHWTLEEPCLHTSDEGAGDWERGGLYKSCLVEHDGTYYMFYNAKTVGEPWTEQSGLVTSRDLKTWTRAEGNPLIRVGEKGSFDDVFCSDPCVVRCGDVWTMFFFTLSSDGHARESVAFSEDLRHWRKSGKVLIDVGAEGSIDAMYAHKPAVIAKDGKLYHYYCAVCKAPNGRVGDVETNEIRGITVATS